MFDTVIGPKSDPDAIDRLLEVLGGLGLEGTVYVGYPMVLVGDQPRAADGLLTCREHGVIVFDVRRDAMLAPPAQTAVRSPEPTAGSGPRARSVPQSHFRRALDRGGARGHSGSQCGSRSIAPHAPPTVRQAPPQPGLPRFSLRRPYTGCAREGSQPPSGSLKLSRIRLWLPVGTTP